MRFDLVRQMLAGIILVSAAFDVCADAWVLDTEASSLYCGSTKNSNVHEKHYFKTLRGFVTAQGDANLIIDLHSVETMIPIRNERMRAMLFNIDTEAVFNAQLPVNFSEVAITEVSGTLSLQDISRPVKAGVHLQWLSDRQVWVVTTKPLVIDAAGYNLLPGLERLRKVVGLASIDTRVPVTFSLLFTKNP